LRWRKDRRIWAAKSIWYSSSSANQLQDELYHRRIGFSPADFPSCAISGGLGQECRYFGWDSLATNCVLIGAQALTLLTPSFASFAKDGSPYFVSIASENRQRAPASLIRQAVDADVVEVYDEAGGVFGGEADLGVNAESVLPCSAVGPMFTVVAGIGGVELSSARS
jgi:hypothetical protein